MRASRLPAAPLYAVPAGLISGPLCEALGAFPTPGHRPGRSGLKGLFYAVQTARDYSEMYHFPLTFTATGSQNGFGAYPGP